MTARAPSHVVTPVRPWLYYGAGLACGLALAQAGSLGQALAHEQGWTRGSPLLAALAGLPPPAPAGLPPPAAPMPIPIAADAEVAPVPAPAAQAGAAAAVVATTPPAAEPAGPDLAAAARELLEPVADAADAATRALASAAARLSEPGQTVAGATTLQIPVAGVTPEQLSDTYTDSRGSDRVHEAIDIMAPSGTPVLAADDGRVEKLFYSKPGGITLYQFDRSGRLAYYYAHLESYAAGVVEGRELKRGEVLGYVGASGNANPSAPHLHFAVFELGPERKWWQGKPINPYPLLTSKAAPALEAGAEQGVAPAGRAAAR